MDENSSKLSLQKGKRIVLKWIIHDFFPQYFGSSNYWYLESCPFPMEESEFKICIIPWYKECPGRAACLLIKDKIVPSVVYYLVNSEITINKNTWKQPESNCCFDSLKPKHVPLMHLSDLKDETKFPPMCQMTLQFDLRKCILKKTTVRHFSVITEIPITSVSNKSKVEKSNSSHTKLQLVKKKYPKNDIVENETIQNHPSNKEKELVDIKIGFCKKTKSVGTLFRTKEDSISIRYEITILDAQRNTIVASTVGKKLLSKPEGFLVPLTVPKIILQKVRSSELVFEAIDANVIVSYPNKHKTDFQTESNFSFSSSKNKCFNLKTDKKNLRYNGKSNFCITAGERTFQVHRCIITARSSISKSTLQNNIVEKGIGSVEIEELSSEVAGLHL